MKILAVSTYYLPYRSGLTLSLHRMAREINALNKKTIISVLTNKHDWGLSDTSIVDGVSVNRIPHSLRISKGFIPSPFALKRIVSLILGNHALLVNLPSFEGFVYICIARIFRKKIVCILGCLIYWDNGVLSRLVSVVSRIVTYLQIIMADLVVSYSADYVSHNGILRSICKDKCSYLQPFINTSRADKAYTQDLLKKKGREVWIGYCGRISREKGVHLLINALKKMPPSISWRLVLIGPGESAGERDYAEAITTSLNESGFRPPLRLHDLSESRISSALTSCDLLVLPSLNATESFGMAQAEALVRGTPVITTNLPGVRELVVQTNTGIIVPPGDTEKLSLALLKTLGDNAKLKSEAQKQQSRLYMRFESSELVKKYVALFSSLLHLNK